MGRAAPAHTAPQISSELTVDPLAAIAADLARNERRSRRLDDKRFVERLENDATRSPPEELRRQLQDKRRALVSLASHIEAMHPTFSKVLVRYNPGGDPVMNKEQAARLKQLSDYLRSKNNIRFMFEMLVPAEKARACSPRTWGTTRTRSAGT